MDRGRALELLQQLQDLGGENPLTLPPAHLLAAKRLYNVELLLRNREQVRRVMRYAGPRMLLRHPVLALLAAFATGVVVGHVLSRR